MPQNIAQGFESKDLATIELALGMEIAVLRARYDVSEATIDFLTRLGYARVEELSSFAVDEVESEARRCLTEAEINKLEDICECLRLIKMKRIFFCLPSSPAPSILPSSAHGRGVCHPCAWFHTAAGCRQGFLCGFCHECPDGELKRRKKEKKSLVKTLRRNNDDSLASLSASFDSTVSTANSPLNFSSLPPL